MIVLTGGAGFIGSHVLRALNGRGESDVLVVDDLTDGRKVHNLAGMDFADYMDCEDFVGRFESTLWCSKIRAVLHLGACSATTEWDGRYLMRNNYEYSKRLLSVCQQRQIPLVYASSASVYGLGTRGFTEDSACELPINAYAFSKWQFDQFVRRMLAGRVSPVAGLRFFNVYGEREQHKGSMASTVHHFSRQLRETGSARLFAASHGYAAGEQRRDFVDVRDCADVVCHFGDGSDRSGIFNVGTGKSRTFNDVANLIIGNLGFGKVEYIDFPPHLVGAYQSNTEADLSRLRAAGYVTAFRELEVGVADFLHATSGCIGT